MIFNCVLQDAGFIGGHLWGAMGGLENGRIALWMKMQLRHLEILERQILSNLSKIIAQTLTNSVSIQKKNPYTTFRNLQKHLPAKEGKK